ncbi:MAG: hypothetical protein KF712_16395 [Akkermansiaceae bacterium]|nr:hypothetical protein [Akkermansiaceae bacterium]
MNEFYTRLYEKAELLFTILAPIAFVLIVLSLWSSVSNGNRSATMYLRALVHAIVVVALLSQFSEWLSMGERIVDSLVRDTLQARPDEVYEKYKSMTASSSDEASGGFWHRIFSEDGLFKAFVAAVLWIAQFIAKLVVFIAYVIYKVVLAFAIAASPIFIGFLSVRSLNSVGMRFMLGTVGILLWPLGWGFASLVTDTFLDVMAEESFVAASGMEGMENLLAVAAAGLWIVFSTIAAPLVIQKMITEGTNAGAAFLQGGYNAAKAGIQSAATAGAAIAGTGVGAPMAAAGAAAASAMAAASSSVSGSPHSSIGGLASNAAHWGKSTFNSSDPANDRQASAAIGKSRRSNRN